MILVQEPLDFHLLFGDTMGLIPVQFSFPDIPAWQPHLRHAFKLSPAAAAELLLQPHDITDAAPDGNRLDYLDITNYLKLLWEHFLGSIPSGFTGCLSWLSRISHQTQLLQLFNLRRAMFHGRMTPSTNYRD
jgi:hypothetical protein